MTVVSNERPPDESAFLGGERDAGESDIVERISDRDEPGVKRQGIHRCIGQVNDGAFAGNQRTSEADGLSGIGESVEWLPICEDRFEFIDG